MSSAAQAWTWRVQAHHEQSIRVQQAAGWRTETYPPNVAARFAADPRRTDDPSLNRLLQLVTPDSTALDVGGGGGRFALPLALACRRITVVEPSQPMVATLRAGAAAAGITNLSIVEQQWEEATVEPADLVLCAHVVYGVEAIVPFIRKLVAHARQRVALLLTTSYPAAFAAPLWPAVHGEERITLPALPELLPVLWEMDIWPDVEMLAIEHRSHTRPALTEMLHHQTYAAAGTPAGYRLAAALDALVEPDEEHAGNVTLRGARPRHVALVTWQTA